VEYRVKQHAAKLRDKLAALGTAETSSETTLFRRGRAKQLLLQAFQLWVQAY
jgi:hypothetical protein